MPGYSRVVAIDEIKSPANDYNLNIRRYADNSPPPEPQDVRAHLVGGVPKREVEAHKGLFAAHGFDPMKLFVKRDADYLDFKPGIADKAKIKELIESDPGVKAKEAELMAAFEAWWKKATHRLAKLPETRDIMKIRKEFLDSFEKTLVPVGLLDRFKIRGVLATWWEQSKEELKTIAEQGFEQLIDGWIETIRYGMEDTETSKNERLDLFEHKLVKKLLPDYLKQIGEAQAKVGELSAQKEAFESGESAEEGEWEPDEDGNDDYAKFLENRAKELKQAMRDRANQRPNQENELRDVEAKLRAYQQTKKALSHAKKALGGIIHTLLERLNAVRPRLTEKDCVAIALEIARQEVEGEMLTYAKEHLQEVMVPLFVTVEKYAEDLVTTAKQRARTSSVLDNLLHGLYHG